MNAKSTASPGEKILDVVNILDECYYGDRIPITSSDYGNNKKIGTVRQHHAGQYNKRFPARGSAQQKFRLVKNDRLGCQSQGRSFLFSQGNNDCYD